MTPTDPSDDLENGIVAPEDEAEDLEAGTRTAARLAADDDPEADRRLPAWRGLARAMAGGSSRGRKRRRNPTSVVPVEQSAFGPAVERAAMGQSQSVAPGSVVAAGGTRNGWRDVPAEDVPRLEAALQRAIDERAPEVNRRAARAMAGRVSKDTMDSFDSLTGNLIPVILPPNDAENAWRLHNLDVKALEKYSPTRLMQYLADLSPEISNAVWVGMRLLNPGWECKAYKIGTRDPDERGQAVLDEGLNQLKLHYGSVDVPIGRLFMNAILRGAFFAEGILDEKRRPIDIAIPDAATARFKPVNDPLRGRIWQLGQIHLNALGTTATAGGDGFVALDRETVRYVPVDPFPGSPYGRALVSPALFAGLFLLGLLHDIRRVVAQQGYPRIDISVLVEKLQAMMPGDVVARPEHFQAWVDAAVQAVEDALGDLEPDDSYVHTDAIVMNKPVGAVDSSSLGAVDGLIKMLERMLARALKTMPLLMGITEGASEANANRQWEVQAAGIKALQHLGESILEHLFSIFCIAQGVVCTVEFRFAELRASERLRDAQAERLEIENEKQKYAAGWTSHEEGSLRVTGHDPDNKEGPRTPLGPVAPAGGDPAAAAADAQPEPGDSRARPRTAKIDPLGELDLGEGDSRTRFTPKGADSPLPSNDVPQLGEDDGRDAAAEWNRAMPDYDGLLNATVIGADDA